MVLNSMVWYGVVCHDIIDMVWYEKLEDNWREKKHEGWFKKIYNYFALPMVEMVS